MYDDDLLTWGNNNYILKRISKIIGGETKIYDINEYNVSYVNEGLKNNSLFQTDVMIRDDTFIIGFTQIYWNNKKSLVIDQKIFMLETGEILSSHFDETTGRKEIVTLMDITPSMFKCIGECHNVFKDEGNIVIRPFPNESDLCNEFSDLIILSISEYIICRMLNKRLKDRKNDWLNRKIQHCVSIDVLFTISMLLVRHFITWLNSSNSDGLSLSMWISLILIVINIMTALRIYILWWAEEEFLLL